MINPGFYKFRIYFRFRSNYQRDGIASFSFPVSMEDISDGYFIFKKLTSCGDRKRHFPRGSFFLVNPA
jgi:hypothetical protein